jgi:hypothetical protein
MHIRSACCFLLAQGWLSSTKSFFSGVAQEVTSLVKPIPDPSLHSNAGQLSSPIGNSYQPQQNGYGAPNQQQQQYSQGYGQQQPPQHQQHNSQDYMGQFDSQLNREINGGQRYAGGGGSNVPSPAHNRVAQGGYGQVDSSWGDQNDGILPVVPLATQYAGSKPGSRRASLDPNSAPNPSAFPTSHFPTSPTNALSQQLQPLNHPNYTPQQHQQGPQQHSSHFHQPPSGQANVHNISEFTGVSTLSGSPSPPPSQPTGIAGGFQQPYNPLMQSASYPLQPNAAPQSNLAAGASAAAAPQPNGRPGGAVWYPGGGQQPLGGVPLHKPVSYDAPPPVFNPALAAQHSQPPSAVASSHQAVPQARRVLDENSINPNLSGPQPNLAYGQPPSNGYISQQQPQPLQSQSSYVPPPSSMTVPPLVQSYGYSAAPSALSSPGRVLSPAFQTTAGAGPHQQQQGGGGGNQTIPAGNIMARPQMNEQMQQAQPQMPPPSQYGQSQQSSYPQQPQQSGYQHQQQQTSLPSSSLPPPPPVSNYWKQRAAVAGPDTTPVLGGRVDYSDLDYKSMDFAYDNRYEKPGTAAGQHASQQAPPSSLQSQHPSSYGAPVQPPSYGLPQQPAQQQQQQQSIPAQGNYNPYAR